MARSSCNNDFGGRNYHGADDAFPGSVSWSFLNSPSASPLHIYNDEPVLLPPYSANPEEKLGELRDRLAQVKACTEALTVPHQWRSGNTGATTLAPDAWGGFPWDCALHGYNTSLTGTTPLDSELTHFRSAKRRKTIGTPNHRVKTKRNRAGERPARRQKHCRSNASPARHHQQQEMAFIGELPPQLQVTQFTHPAIMAFFASQHFLVPMGEPEAFPFCYTDIPQHCDPIQLKQWEEPLLQQELAAWFTCPSQAVPFFDAELEAMLDELVCTSGRDENLLYEEDKDVEERVADDLEAVLDDLLRVTSEGGDPPPTEIDPISAVSQRPVISNHPAFDISALGSGFRYLKPVKRRPSVKRKQRQSKRKQKKSSSKKTEQRPNKRSHVIEDSV
ncbi:hypothetical protein QOT17_016380 [Balamuthia mandrillaris]